MRRQDGTLYKPDLAVIQGDSIVICEVEVNWEEAITLAQAYENKKRVYDNEKFREAAAAKWPN